MRNGDVVLDCYAAGIYNCLGLSAYTHSIGRDSVPKTKTDNRGGSLPNQLRFGDLTESEMRDNATGLAERAAEMLAIADSMAALDIKTVRVDSITKLARADDLLVTYLAKLEMAVVQAKYEQKRRKI